MLPVTNTDKVSTTTGCAAGRGHVMDNLYAENSHKLNFVR